jgi:eukaryotic-like serine/threonine-protein kinase
MALLNDVIAECREVEALAEGGQKKVFAALHPRFGQVVIKRGEYRYTTTLERVAREVELLRELDSRYYPRLHEFHVDTDSMEFLILEERLDAIELTHTRDRFSDDVEIRGLLQKLVCALNVIWSRNVIHRDLKPANILITPDGEPRIIDLGIARFLDDTSLTATLAARGPATPIYAAPEQLMNKKTMINHRTDFFLLGIVILEQMLGFHPHDPRYVGNGVSLVENLMQGKYVRPEATRDPVLTEFVVRVLHPQPFRRFRNVQALMKHLTMDQGLC